MRVPYTDFGVKDDLKKIVKKILVLDIETKKSRKPLSMFDIHLDVIRYRYYNLSVYLKQ